MIETREAMRDLLPVGDCRKWGKAHEERLLGILGEHFESTPVAAAEDFFGREHFLLYAAEQQVRKAGASVTFNTLVYPMLATERPMSFARLRPLEPAAIGLDVRFRHEVGLPQLPEGVIRDKARGNHNFREYKNFKQLGRLMNANLWAIQAGSFCDFAERRKVPDDVIDFGPGTWQVVEAVAERVQSLIS